MPTLTTSSHALTETEHACWVREGRRTCADCGRPLINAHHYVLNADWRPVCIEGAGCRAGRLHVRVADGLAEGLDIDGGRWQVICETHGSILSVESRAAARNEAGWARQAGYCEWCENCTATH